MQINSIITALQDINPNIITKYNLNLNHSSEKLHVLVNKMATELLAKYFFCFPAQSANCFFDLQVGNGGQDGEDWTNMLFIMYKTYWNNHDIKYDIIDINKTPSGLKSIKLQVYTCWTKWMSEHGIHRLVRKSPFNAKNKRQTSFTSVRIYPLLKQAAQSLPTKDLRIDTYNASGAGGQHVNKTESAVRITHLPSNIVVQCQQYRSQHQNKTIALELLASKLLLIDQEKQHNIYNQNKLDINFGQQTRSYVLDPKVIINDHQLAIKEKNNKILSGHLDNLLQFSQIKLFLYHITNTHFFINRLKQIT